MKSEKHLDPWTLFVYEMLKYATASASSGDMFELAWLAVYGTMLAGSIAPRTGRRCVLAFCAETFERMKHGQTHCRFPLVLSDIATTDEFMAFAADWCA